MKLRFLPHTVTAVLLAAAASVPTGCATRAVRPVVQGDPAPMPNSPAAVLRLFEWCYNNRAIRPYAEIFPDDFRFYFNVRDSAGAYYITNPWRREDELIYAARLFANSASITLILDRNFVVLPDPRHLPTDPLGRWHKTISTQVLLGIRTVDGTAVDISGQVTFYLVRGDSALIPEELKARGFGPDSARWWIQRWDDETVQEGDGGWPGGEIIGPARAMPTTRKTWGALKVLYRTLTNQRPGENRAPSRAIAAIPSAGPSASTGNAQRQPVAAAIAGTSWMVAMVSRNPIDVWSMSAVPTACAGAASVTMALNCAESATTKNPQIAVRTMSSHHGPPNASAASTQQVPETAIDHVTTRA